MDARAAAARCGSGRARARRQICRRCAGARARRVLCRWPARNERQPMPRGRAAGARAGARAAQCVGVRARGTRGRAQAGRALSARALHMPHPPSLYRWPRRTAQMRAALPRARAAASRPVRRADSPHLLAPLRQVHDRLRLRRLIGLHGAAVGRPFVCARVCTRPCGVRADAAAAAVRGGGAQRNPLVRGHSALGARERRRRAAQGCVFALFSRAAKFC
jgi:hypothetical protein